MIRTLSLLSTCLFLGNAAHTQPTGLPLNPEVESMLASISADTLFANLGRLVGFHTRHTASDTVSDLSGIGAARRYIHRQFQSYAADPQTIDLQPSYFVFPQTVCNIAGEHRNVLATLSGSKTADRFFLVTAHFDSRNEDNCDAVGFAPGANDDCSGTVVAMEMARTMSKFAMESTVILMPVTGEEQGLFGSEAYAEFALNQGMRIDGTITNDIVGNIEGCVNPDCPPGEPVIVDSMSVRHFSGDPATGGSRQLARYMRLQTERYFPEFTVTLVAALDRPGRGGDHIPFYDRGFAAARFTEANETGLGDGSSGRQHNMFDTISTVNTNKGYMASVAKVNVAGVASLALAPASPVGLTVVDAGDGVSAFLSWPLEQMESDFAGYMIASRDPDSLYYAGFFDAGNTDLYTVTGLIPGEEVLFSLAAYDSSGNLSLFSDEIPVVPMSVPRAPENTDATSDFAGATLVWDANSEIDIAKYRVYRSTVRASGFVAHDSVNVPLTEVVDQDMSPNTMYFYQVHAVDTDGNEGPPSSTVSSQLVTHDRGILVVDGTRDGSGSALAPTDAMVDDHYVALLSRASVGGFYDLADSLALGYRMFDADLSPYSTVIWHTDVRASSPLSADTLSLKKYLLHGGNLIISGWRLSASLQPGAGVGVTGYAPGAFVSSYLKIDSTLTSGFLTQDFRTAVGAFSSYPDISVESARIPVYNGTLVNTDAALPPFSGGPVDVLYTHEGAVGSGLNGKPVGWRFVDALYGLIVFDFPLYYMQTEPGRTALTQALIDLGEPTSVGDEHALDLPLRYQLHQNYPNPFNPTTEIRFDLLKTGRVRIRVYDVLGRHVQDLLDEKRVPGAYRVTWDASGSASGVYYYEIRVRSDENGTEAFRDVKAMVVVR